MVALRNVSEKPMESVQEIASKSVWHCLVIRTEQMKLTLFAGLAVNYGISNTIVL